MKNDPTLGLSHQPTSKHRYLFLLPVIALLALTATFVLQRSAKMQGEDEPERTSQTVAGWTTTGSLGTARRGHTATLLQNGKVLVAGGVGTNGSELLNSAELYDPASGVWTATNNILIARTGHTAILLPNGKVLTAGGSTFAAVLNSAEIYDPATGTWTATGNLTIARSGHTVTLLQNGKVLAAGGNNNGGPGFSSELYDPTAGTWTASGSFEVTSRHSHTATLLPNGKVLVTGGSNLSSGELYDPATGNWTLTGNLSIARTLHTATLLPNGKVLVAGGGYSTSSLASAELYDHAVGIWTATSSLGSPRYDHTATLLPSGKVLLAGGDGIGGRPSAAETYDPASGIWSGAGILATPRNGHTATLLQNGKVLVAGGVNGVSLNSSELYDPATPSPTPTPTPTPTACTTNPVVTSNADSGLGSLRQAVADACPGSIVTFSNAVTSPIVLVSDSIVITKSLNIQGPTSNALAISGNNFFRVISVSGPVTVTISRLTITGGRRSAGNGAGIINFDGSNLTLNDCTVTGNSILGGDGSGGGILNFEATLNVFNSTVSNNHSRTRGGGIGNNGVLNVVNSTISGNAIGDASFSGGGGIYVVGGSANIVNTTITANSVTGFVNNFPIFGGGIFNDRGTVTMRNTIVAGNTNSGGNGVGPDIAGSFNSQGYNLIGRNDGSTSFPAGNPNVNFDIVGTNALPINPLLGPLAGNSGPTQTHALLAGSPAIDKGSSASNPVTGGPILSDQRGLTRPVNNASIPPAGTAGNDSDIGAYEVQGQTPSPGLEGDVVDSLGAPGGDGNVLANDVGMIRQFALGNLIPVTSPNQFQRADINGACGDGVVNAADVTVARHISLGTITPIAACGPTVPLIVSPVELNAEFEPLSAKRKIRAASVTSSTRQSDYSSILCSSCCFETTSFFE